MGSLVRLHHFIAGRYRSTHESPYATCSMCTWMRAIGSYASVGTCKSRDGPYFRHQVARNDALDCQAV